MMVQLQGRSWRNNNIISNGVSDWHRTWTLIIAIFVATPTYAQLYDFTNFREDGIKKSCNRMSKPWTLQDVNVLPPPSSGALSGSVLTGQKGGACITPDATFKVTKSSTLTFSVYLPYESRSDVFTVWLVNLDETDSKQWVEVLNRQPEAWIERCVPLPGIVPPGEYKMEVVAQSNARDTSIRFFAVGENCLLTTTTKQTTTELTTMEVTEEPSTESTVEITNEPSTESTIEITDEPTTESTIEITDEPSTESTIEITDEPTTESTIEITDEPSTESTIEITDEPSTESTIEITDEPSTESTIEITDEPSTESTIEITDEPSTESTIEITDEPSTESTIEITDEPTTESTIEITDEPTTESTIEITDEPSTESTIEITDEPSTESTIEITDEPTTESTVEITDEPTTESTIEITDEPSTESTVKITDEPSTESTVKITDEPTTESTVEITDKPTTSLVQTTWPTSTPSPSVMPPFIVDGWSVLIGVAAGLLLFSLLSILALCWWWAWLRRRRRPREDEKSMMQLPRLQVIPATDARPGVNIVGTSAYSGYSTPATAYQSRATSDFSSLSNWSFKPQGSY